MDQCKYRDHSIFYPVHVYPLLPGIRLTVEKKHNIEYTIFWFFMKPYAEC